MCHGFSSQLRRRRSGDAPVRESPASSTGGGPVAGASPPYGIANVAIDHVPVDIGIETGLWRSAAHSYTCFFTESFDIM